jgi:hypothetical protein
VRAAFAPIHGVISLVAWAAWLALASCSSAPPRTPVGMSDAPPEAATPVTISAPRPVWADFAAARAWPEAAPALPALAHRRDGTLIHVRVEASALEAYRALATDAPMPEGARVAAFHETPSGEFLGGYVLEKRAGVWSATELDARGAQVRNDGAACLRCHALAPADHLFGVTSRASAARQPGPGGN